MFLADTICNIEQLQYPYIDNVFQATAEDSIRQPSVVLPFSIDIKNYEQLVSNYDICKDMKRLFSQKSVYNRLSDIFEDEDILNNKIKLNKQSFLSFYSKIKDIENKLSTYTIGISNDGCVVVQYDDIQKYIYVKFFYEDNIFYNLYAKRNKLFDLVRTGTFKDLDTDYEKLCTVVA